MVISKITEVPVEFIEGLEACFGHSLFYGILDISLIVLGLGSDVS